MSSVCTPLVIGVGDEYRRPVMADLELPRAQPQTSLRERLERGRPSWSEDPGEYELRVIDHRGVFLPVDLDRRVETTPRRYRSHIADVRHGSGTAENEHTFQGSFAAFRRSFDIRAHLPVVDGRRSEDSQASADSVAPRPSHKARGKAVAVLTTSRRPVRHDDWSPPPWSPWRRDSHAQEADTHSPTAISFRGAGGAMLRR